ncbi:threonine/serine exporter family protein [Lachnospiraceae bacterium ZAX-1]
MIMQIIVSIVATISFAVRFHVPRGEYVYCAINGTLGWVAYWFFINHEVSVSVASLAATFIMAILSRILSILRKCPATVFLVTGIFTLVPGAGIYSTAYYLITGDITLFTEKGIETFKIAGAIVLGIVFGFALPQIWFNKLAKRK